jgi:hypothetical protein
MSRYLLPLLVVAYVALVLLVDTLASQNVQWLIDWEQFDWKPTHAYAWLVQALPGIPREYIAWMRNGDLHRFEVFKFVFWLLIPFIFCLPRMDWRWIGWRHWYSADLAVLLGLALCGMVAMLLIPEFQSLRSKYPSMSVLPLDMKLDYLGSKLFWVLSWLVGWEFLHRYVLLRASFELSPRWGWWLVPISEGLYHLQKPLLEAGGMVVLSIILTQWAMRRQNLLLPFLVHFLIEVELLLFVLFA